VTGLQLISFLVFIKCFAYFIWSVAINSYYWATITSNLVTHVFDCHLQPKNPLGHRLPSFGPSGEYFILVFGGLRNYMVEKPVHSKLTVSVP
jgi:hypothetical protein